MYNKNAKGASKANAPQNKNEMEKHFKNVQHFLATFHVIDHPM